jgi:HAD superfamily hydrolase (TIGR01509 family)
MSRRPRAILWDNDGVLVDTERLYFEATRDTLASTGVVLTPELYYDLFLVQSRGAWHLAEGRGFGPEAIARLKAERDERYSRLLAAGAEALPGVHEALQLLAPRHRMAIVTSSRRRHFEIIHGRTGLLPYFEFAITIDECGRCKPDPEPYLRATNRLGIEPAECLAIEDSERGLAAACAAGVPCWVVPTAETRHGDFARAGAVLGSVLEAAGRLAGGA